jgi:transcriptional regulator with XRE-family HTH domain
MEDPEFRKLLSVEALVAEASEVIASLMAQQNLSKADLARRLNRSRAWVTQLLSGKANMTVRTLAEVAHALGAEVKIEAQTPSGKMAGGTLGASRMRGAILASRGRGRRASRNRSSAPNRGIDFQRPNRRDGDTKAQ